MKYYSNEEERVEILSRYPGKSLDTLEFIFRMEKKFGKNHFDFSDTLYEKDYSPLKFKCRVHNTFCYCTPREAITYSCPCQFCRDDSMYNSDPFYTKLAINRFPNKSYRENIIIGNIYKLVGDENLIDCSKLIYISSTKSLNLFCNKHNKEFSLKYSTLVSHFKNNDPNICPDCHRENKEKVVSWRMPETIPEDLKLEFPDKDFKTLSFIKRVRETLKSDIYDFSKTVYTRLYDPITVRCIKHNIEFITTPKIILKFKEGACPSCRIESKNKDIPKEYLELEKTQYPLKDLKTQYFIAKFYFRSKEEDRYKFDFSKFNYSVESKESTLICNEHSIEISVSPKKLLSIINKGTLKYVCPECKKESLSFIRDEELSEEKINSIKSRYPNKSPRTIQFIYKAEEFWGKDKYDFSETTYLGKRTKIKVKCNDHETLYFQSPLNLLNGFCACPECSGFKGESKISGWLRNNLIEYIPHYNIKINSKTYFIDFLVKFKNKSYWIEFNGEQHYRPTEHFGGEKQFYEYQIPRDKLIELYCKENNINLVVIPYTEYNNIDSILTNIFLSDENKTKILEVFSEGQRRICNTPDCISRVF